MLKDNVGMGIIPHVENFCNSGFALLSTKKGKKIKTFQVGEKYTFYLFFFQSISCGSHEEIEQGMERGLSLYLTLLWRKYKIVQLKRKGDQIIDKNLVHGWKYL